MLRFGLTRLARARLIAFGNSGSVSAAALSLNFLTGTLDARITFTRASTATFVGSNGLIQSATTNTPRFDYNPSTLAALGLLIEEQRTNIITQSQFASGWTQSSVVATLNANVAPDGTTTGTKLQDAAVTSDRQFFQAFTATAVAYTQSVYAKAGTASWLGMGWFGSGDAYFNLSTGAIGTLTAGTTATITNAGGGWYRCTITKTLTAATAYANVGVYTADNQGSYAAAGTENLYVWGEQLEIGTFATSYIPTTSAAVTRSADVASMTGTNFSSWFNASAGTFVFDVDLLGSAGAQPITEIDDGTTNNRFFLYTSALSSILRVDTGAVNQANLTYGTVVAGTPYKSAFAYQVNDIAVSQSGGAIQSVGVATIPAVTTMRLGVDLSGNGSSRHFRAITFYNTRQSNAQLQVLST